MINQFELFLLLLFIGMSTGFLILVISKIILALFGRDNLFKETHFSIDEWMVGPTFTIIIKEKNDKIL